MFFFAYFYFLIKEFQNDEHIGGMYEKNIFLASIRI